MKASRVVIALSLLTLLLISDVSRAARPAPAGGDASETRPEVRYLPFLENKRPFFSLL